VCEARSGKPHLLGGLRGDCSESLEKQRAQIDEKLSGCPGGGYTPVSVDVWGRVAKKQGDQGPGKGEEGGVKVREGNARGEGSWGGRGRKFPPAWPPPGASGLANGSSREGAGGGAWFPPPNLKTKTQKIKVDGAPNSCHTCLKENKEAPSKIPGRKRRTKKRTRVARGTPN